MALPLFKEKRFSLRKGLTGVMPGKLVDTNGKEFVCIPKDVSQHGMGVTSQHLLNEGDVVTLRFREQDIELKVTWVQLGFGKRDIRRYGFTAVRPDFNLEAVFLEAGCLR